MPAIPSHNRFTPGKSAGVDTAAFPAGIIPPRIAAGCGKAFTVVLFSLLTAIAMLVATLVILPGHSHRGTRRRCPGDAGTDPKARAILWPVCFFPAALTARPSKRRS